MSTNTPFAIQLYKEQCSGCGLCADSCTYNAITFNDYPVIHPLKCQLCGSCVRNCPNEALIMSVPEKETKGNSFPGKGIWILAETEDGKLSSVSKELLGKATELAGKNHQQVEAILIGYDISRLADELITYGADNVHLIDHKCFAHFIEENYANAVAHLINRKHPDILLVGATNKGRGLSARLASILKTGLTADCTNLDICEENGLLHQIRPAFGGNLMATIMTPDCRPQMASVRPGIMKANEPDSSRKGQIYNYTDETFVPDTRITVLEECIEQKKRENLENSKVIVGIGRGVKSRKTVDAIQNWAEKIGATVAGSRAAVEAGLIDASLQVGQTGHTIAPDLYIAIGISGQIQHTAAITGAKKIIAINPDANAPIFRVADYGWPISAEDFLAQL